MDKLNFNGQSIDKLYKCVTYKLYQYWNIDDIKIKPVKLYMPIYFKQ